MNAATKQILLRFYCLQSSLLSAHLGSQCIRMCTRGNVALQILDRIHETRRDMSKSSFTAPREQSYHCYRDGCTGSITFNVILNSTIYYPYRENRIYFHIFLINIFLCANLQLILHIVILLLINK